MSAIECRAADLADVDELARIRATEWGTQPYWQTRISGYMRGELHPRESLPPRVVLLASANDIILGFIAGHLTRRFGCDGEVEWLNVIPARRRTGVAAALFHALATWFGTRQARRVCVDVNPHTRQRGRSIDTTELWTSTHIGWCGPTSLGWRMTVCGLGDSCHPQHARI